jgi:hypothetical protein
MANVANTASNISGDTLLTAENNETKSGLLTFDRGAATAPFAVAQATAAKVTNLDADKLDGLDSTAFLELSDVVSSSYTPTWSGTIGNGTISGKSLQFGKLVFFEIVITWGNTTSHAASAQTFTLPVAAVATGRACGVGVVTDSGAGQYTCLGFINGSGTLQFYNADGLQGGAFTNTAPMAWTTNDSLTVSGWYFAA